MSKLSYQKQEGEPWTQNLGSGFKACSPFTASAWYLRPCLPHPSAPCPPPVGRPRGGAQGRWLLGDRGEGSGLGLGTAHLCQRGGVWGDLSMVPAAVTLSWGWVDGGTQGWRQG